MIQVRSSSRSVKTTVCRATPMKPTATFAHLAVVLAVIDPAYACAPGERMDGGEIHAVLPQVLLPLVLTPTVTHSNPLVPDYFVCPIKSNAISLAQREA